LGQLFRTGSGNGVEWGRVGGKVRAPKLQVVVGRRVAQPVPQWNGVLNRLPVPW